MIWTDTFQTLIIIGGVLMATISAIVSVGGIQNVWNIASEHDRTDIFEYVSSSASTL